MVSFVNFDIHVSILITYIYRRCPSTLDKRWHTYPSKDAGRCGDTAPPIDGKYLAVCDPDDAQYHCCGHWGYCGTAAEYCDCKDCVDYEKHPELVDQKAPDEVYKYSLFMH